MVFKLRGSRIEIAKLNFILLNTILYKKNRMELVPSYFLF